MPALDASAVHLCATQRLARHLQLRHGQAALAQSQAVWPSLAAFTFDAWLAQTGEAIALSGAVPLADVPARVLDTYAAVLLWRQVLEQAPADESDLDLFNRHSLAETAAAADALVVGWRLPLDSAEATEETQRFQGWRRDYLTRCREHGWLDRARYRERVLDWLAQGHGRLPETLVLAGFDTLPPALRRLQQILEERGTVVDALTWPPGEAAVTVSAADAATAECAAAAAWARAHLQQNPAARLGLVVADLDSRRALLTPLLDAALAPATLTAASDAPSPAYNLSLGEPLLRQEMVTTALQLLRALTRPGGLPPAELGALLRRPYWSADLADADLRARLDARLRERPGQTVSWASASRLAHSAPLAHHLDRLGQQASAWQAERRGATAAVWVQRFDAALAALAWPGERRLSSTEFQVRASWREVLAEFAGLDELLGPLSAAAAVSELQRCCGETLFQPQTTHTPPLQVLGMLEATGAQFDALWVMGMNDDLWPPPARPNPLLPAELQRRVGTPAASAEVQARFARAIHADLLQAAPVVVFSYAERDGDRDLRPSPLIAAAVQMAGDTLASAHHAAPAASSVLAVPSGLAGSAALAPTAALTAFAAEAEAATARFEWLDDACAPPVAVDEVVSGGSSLLKAQALCPAWAFYRYRLGAKALQAPPDGLDAATRGQLVHASLEYFWQQAHDLAGLRRLTDAVTEAAMAAQPVTALTAQLAVAVETALAGMEAQLDEPLGPTLRQLEARRLKQLCAEWLRFEGEDRIPFAVAACEESHMLTLGQLTIRLVIDRIDVLTADGRRIVLDYKTGGKQDIKQWFRERIGEPQLPLYAALVLAEQGQGEQEQEQGEKRHSEVAAVAFARVRRGDCCFTGVALAEGLLPGVPASDDWAGLLAAWKTKLLALAGEIERGDAAVRVERERDLDYCEVRPLLRLTERREQFERHKQRGAGHG